MNEELVKIKKAQRQFRQQRICEDSHDRLKMIARKKFNTSFIFPLAEFELTFGQELWGHGLPDDTLTPIQKANRARWEQVRTAILNNGNTQSRAFEAELDLHDIKFVGYHAELIGGNNDEGK